jgi:ethanolamine-phosphate cytidylyltransferase
MCNGVWDMYHCGHANAWLQAKLAAKADLGDVEIIVAVHDGADVLHHKGRPTIFSDVERVAMAGACKWVSEAIAHVPYDVITASLLDRHHCDFVAHGDDMIILPGKPHMYSEAEAAGRFRMFPRTPGISTTAQRSRVHAVLGGGNVPGDPSTFPPTSEIFRRFGSQSPVAWAANAPTVYLSGAFDMYNPGDVALLDSAGALGKTLGARVVVGILHDSDVAALAGSELLPIVPMHERALCVMSHQAVDDVVLGAPLVLSEELIESLNICRVAMDARPLGRYGLPKDAWDVANAAGLSEEIIASVGSVSPELTAEAVLERQAKYFSEEKSKMHPVSMIQRSNQAMLFPSSVVGSLPRPDYLRELVMDRGVNGGPKPATCSINKSDLNLLHAGQVTTTQSRILSILEDLGLPSRCWHHPRFLARFLHTMAQIVSNRPI